jgi:hypothetical protein
MSKAKKKPAKKTAKKRAPQSPRAVTKKAAKKKTPKKAAKKVAKRKAVKKVTAKKVVKKTAKKAAKKAAVKKGVKRAKKRPAAAAATRRVATKKPSARKRAAPQVEGSLATPPVEATIVPATPAETLLALAKLLLDKPQYHQDVQLAIDSPNDYVDSFAEELALRGIDGAVPSLPWIALTDGLARHGALVQLDRNFEPDELTMALDQLPISPPGREQLKGMVGYSTAEEGLAATGDRLLAAGLALITVDNKEVEDSFPVAAMNASDVPQAQRLAGELGLGSIRQWSSAG